MEFPSLFVGVLLLAIAATISCDDSQTKRGKPIPFRFGKRSGVGGVGGGGGGDFEGAEAGLDVDMNDDADSMMYEGKRMPYDAIPTRFGKRGKVIPFRFGKRAGNSAESGAEVESASSARPDKRTPRIPLRYGKRDDKWRMDDADFLTAPLDAFYYDEAFLDDADLTDATAINDAAFNAAMKRAIPFRFGKRAPIPFRFGKRAIPFRFG